MQKSTKDLVSLISLIASFLIITSTASYMFAIVEADLKHLHSDFLDIEEEHHEMDKIHDKYLNLNSRVMILEFIYDNKNLSELQAVFEKDRQKTKWSKPKFCKKISEENVGK